MTDLLKRENWNTPERCFLDVMEAHQARTVHRVLPSTINLADALKEHLLLF